MRVLLSVLVGSVLCLPVVVHAQHGLTAPRQSAPALAGTGVYALEDGQPVDVVAPSEPLDLHAWVEKHRKFNTWGGATGGFGLVDPSSGAAGSFRMQLGFDFFSSSDVLTKGDQFEANGQSLSLTWTALEMLEVFALVTNRSAVSENIQALGDVTLGGKLFHAFSPVVSLGGDLRINLNSGLGQATPDLAGTSAGLRAAFAADFRGLNSPVPLITRANLGYFWDNTGVLAQSEERRLYGQLGDDALDPKDETRHLLTRQQRFGLGINRVDMINIGLGAELPIEVARDFYLHPLLEWQWGIPVNRQGYDCPNIVGAINVGEITGAQDSCLNKEGVGAWPMTLSLGLRAVTPLRGISAFAGADFGLTGTSKFVRELTPTAPYRVLLGLSVDYDARAAAVQVVEREVQVEVAPEAPLTGRVSGAVVDEAFNTPIANASIAITGQQSALSTGEDGRFVTYDLPPGQVQLTLSHPDYQAGACSATIGPDGAASEVLCALTALPKVGRIEGRVVDMWGAPLAGARVMLTGPGAFSASTDSNGRFAQSDVAAGEYSARVVSETHYIKVASVRVAARQTAALELTVAQLPAASSIVMKPNEITVKGNVKFARGTEVLDAKASGLLAEVADALLRNESLRVRIEGYFDAGSDEMQGLTRALAVRQRLIDAGVGAERLTAIGGTAKRVVFAIEP